MSETSTIDVKGLQKENNIVTDGLPKSSKAKLDEISSDINPVVNNDSVAEGDDDVVKENFSCASSISAVPVDIEISSKFCDIHGKEKESYNTDRTADHVDEIFCMKNGDMEEILFLTLPDKSEVSDDRDFSTLNNNFFKENRYIRNQDVCSPSKQGADNFTRHEEFDSDTKLGSSNKNASFKEETDKLDSMPQECWITDSGPQERWITKDHKTFESVITYSNLHRKDYYDESIFACLPDELVVKIFSYLSTKELCQKAAKVCRKWREISHDHLLWKHLNFSCFPNLSSLNLLWVVRRAPLLHKLVLSGRAKISRAEVAIITESCPVLHEIDFGFCDSIDYTIIQQLSETCPNLTKINVEGCDKIDKRCLKCFVKCKKLTHLNFSHCMAIDDDGVTVLSKGLPRIVSINLDGINFLTDRAVTEIVEQHHAHLEEIELDGAEISDIGMLELSSCRQLRHLGLSFCECMTDQSLGYLKDLKNLESLRLRKGSDFTADAVSKFFKEASLSKLRILNLSECTCVNDHVVLDIALACGKQLRELALSWCWFITDTGLISIVDHCCNMENLDLLGIDKVKGECLARIPDEMPQLKFLDLRQCNKIRDNVIVDMVRRKPDLKVLNYYGEEFVHD